MLTGIRKLLKTSDREVFKIAFPILIQFITNPLFILVDTFFVSHLGTESLAALAAGTFVSTAITGVCFFITFLSTTLSAQALGRGDIKDAYSSGVNSAYLGAVLGVILCIILEVFMYPITAAFSKDPKVIEDALGYLHYFALSIPFVLIYFAFNGLLRGLKLANFTMKVAISATIINTVLNGVFIFVLHMKVAGSGLGTGLTNVIATLIIGTKVVYEIYKLRRNNEKVAIRPNLINIAYVLKNSFPLILRSICLWSSITLMGICVGQLGSIALASMQIINAFWAFGEYLIDAFAASYQILIGVAVGEKNKERAKNIASRCARVCVLVGIFDGFFLLLCTLLFIPHLTSDPDVYFYTLLVTVESMFVFPIIGYAFGLDGIILGLNDGPTLAKMVGTGMVIYFSIALITTRFLPHDAIGLTIAFLSFDLGVMVPRSLIGRNYLKKPDTWFLKATEYMEKNL